ncbi:hypothetical protein EEL30_15485 [Brevibacillus laterosporus]|uniref:PD(D/E)XK endonuclease domain-containing protein n=1 Tax=Brevibacillus laterosporus TaxID=1465 RepID=A0A518V9C2_BRELA|nr:hypothetical protein EEL30_15485 [Brevibacillus laterosporus]
MTEPRYKGVAGELLVQFELAMRNISVYPAGTAFSDCDLVAEVDGKLHKIQVKCGSNTRNSNRIETTVKRGTGVKKREYDEDAFDILAVVDLENRKVAFLPRKELGIKSSVTLWLEPPSPNSSRLEFKDYLEIAS